MRRRPDYILVLGRFDELVLLDRFLRAYAPGYVRRDLVRPTPSLVLFGCYCLQG